MNPEDYRAAMRCVPTGVAIVATRIAGAPKGFTANAFASVSAEPPILLVCVNRGARSHPAIALAGTFSLNLLRLEQQELAERFASHAASDPFAGVALRVDRSGAPILAEALAYFDCTLAEEHSAGTHTIFLGAVVACGRSAGAPLGYFDAGYRDFGCRVP
ncbi:MAG: flavin reductase family protein [Vulcanimicrobiaceae bacterium]